MSKTKQSSKKGGIKGLIIAVAVLMVIVATLITLIVLYECGVFDKSPDKPVIETPKIEGGLLTDGDYSYALLKDGGVILGMFNGEYTDVMNIPSTLGGHTVKAIGELSFANTDEITLEIRVPEGVTYIGKGAFSGIASAKLYLPSTIKYIDDMAMYGFEDPVGIYYSGSRAEWNKVIVGSDNKVLATVICE